METLGQFLKREREFRGMSLEKLAGLTRINPSVLKRIEEDDLAAAPQSIYLKSFLKTYAAHLGLDSNDILGRYEHQKPEEILDPVPMPLEAPRSPTPLIYAIAGLSALAIIVFLFLRYKH